MTLLDPVRRSTAGLALALALAMALGACSTDGAHQPLEQSNPVNPPPASTGSPATGDKTGAPVQTPSENSMQIRFTIGEQRFTATLDDSAATRDLLAQLPVTLDMVDHGGVEKTGPLPHPLSLAGQPVGADPSVGDLGYYAPGKDLVLYYGDQSYFPGIVILGRLDGNAASRIAAMKGPVTTTVEAG